jgi:predicted Zn-dependent protease
VQSKQAYLTTMDELDKDNKLVDDPLMADRVATITGRLVTEAVALYPHTKDWEWSVAIIDDDDTVNAWCMAGGRMAAYTGLFESSGSPTTSSRRSWATRFPTPSPTTRRSGCRVPSPSTLGVVAAGVASEHHGAAMAGAAVAAKLALELPNSRVAEAEADRIGIELATRAGYDPAAAVSLWEKMGALSEERPPEFLSTHPAPENRQAKLQALVPEMQALNPQRRMATVTPVTIVR